MRTTPILTALGMFTAATASAGVSSTWTLASDYDFRGITQTAQDPARQASLDYAHDSGWYVGGWASNVDFCAQGATGCLDADYELDLYTGFAGSFGEEGWVGTSASSTTHTKSPTTTIRKSTPG
jgi:uncharacterized protein (TIGR02001 family)